MAATTKVGALVTRGWLRNALEASTKNLRVLDASRDFAGRQQYLEKHIPTAQHLDLLHCVKPSPTLPYNVPDKACFRDYVQSLGISQDSHIVVYDRVSFFAASRAWWLFRTFGHENVSILDGGLSHYGLNARATFNSGAEDNLEPGNFEIKVNKALIKNFDDVKDVIGARSSQIIDTRRHKHFMGEVEEPTNHTRRALEAMQQPKPKRMTRGHIPGSKNLPYELLIDPDTGLMHTKEELIELFEGHGIRLSKPIIATSYTGFTNCIVALAAHVCGKEDVAIYYGSWTEWAQRADEDDQIRSPQKRKQAMG